MADKQKKTKAVKEKKKKAPAKRKEVKAKGIAEGTELPDSVIPHTGREQFAAVRKSVIKYRGEIDNARWKLSEALFKVHDETIYAHWGYPSWEVYVSTEVGMTVRTAHYLVSMYGYFQIDLLEDVDGLKATDERRIKAVARRDEIVEQIKELGWTKGKCLVGVLNRDNADEWLKKAREMSSTELEGEAKRAIQEAAGLTEEVEVKKGVSFRMTEGQLEPVENALEMAGGLLDSSNRGHQLSMICQDFVATNMAQKDKGSNRMGSYLNKVGAVFGVRIIAVDKETGKVVHNESLIKELQDKG